MRLVLLALDAWLPATQEGLPVSVQKLVYSGKELKDDCTLRDCRIVKESTVHVIAHTAAAEPAADGGGAGGSGTLVAPSHPHITTFDGHDGWVVGEGFDVAAVRRDRASTHRPPLPPCPSRPSLPAPAAARP